MPLHLFTNDTVFYYSHADLSWDLFLFLSYLEAVPLSSSGWVYKEESVSAAEEYNTSGLSLCACQ